MGPLAGWICRTPEDGIVNGVGRWRSLTSGEIVDWLYYSIFKCLASIFILKLIITQSKNTIKNIVINSNYKKTHNRNFFYYTARRNSNQLEVKFILTLIICKFFIMFIQSLLKLHINLNIF